MFLQSFLQRAKHTTFGGVDEVFEKVTPSHDPALWPAFSSSCQSLLLNSRVPVSTDPQTLVINILINATLLGALTQHHLPLFFSSLFLLLLRALRFCCVPLYGSSTLILWETNCICDFFQILCHMGTHILFWGLTYCVYNFLCVQTVVWLLVLKIFNMHTDINAYNCTWVGWGGSGELYIHAKRVCNESLPWEKNRLLCREVEPASAACWMQHLSTELCPHPIAFVRPSFFGFFCPGATLFIVPNYSRLEQI